MKKQVKNLAIFEGRKIRRIWDEKKEKWYFSVIDIVAVLTEQADFKKSQSYWTTLKNRLKMEGSEIVIKCDKLKLQVAKNARLELERKTGQKVVSGRNFKALAGEKRFKEK